MRDLCSIYIWQTSPAHLRQELHLPLRSNDRRALQIWWQRQTHQLQYGRRDLGQLQTGKLALQPLDIGSHEEAVP